MYNSELAINGNSLIGENASGRRSDNDASEMTCADQRQQPLIRFARDAPFFDNGPIIVPVEHPSIARLQLVGIKVDAAFRFVGNRCVQMCQNVARQWSVAFTLFGHKTSIRIGFAGHCMGQPVLIVHRIIRIIATGNKTTESEEEAYDGNENGRDAVVLSLGDRYVPIVWYTSCEYIC